MGQATTTTKLDLQQLERFFGQTVRAVGNLDDTSVKTVIVDGLTDAQVDARLINYVFDPNFSSEVERLSQIAQAMFDSFSDELGTMVVTPGSTFANNSVRDRVIAFIALKLGGKL